MFDYTLFGFASVIASVSYILCTKSNTPACAHTKCMHIHAIIHLYTCIHIHRPTCILFPKRKNTLRKFTDEMSVNDCIREYMIKYYIHI